MRIEHFIVVGGGKTVVNYQDVRIRSLVCIGNVIAVSIIHPRRRMVRNVIQESVVGAQCAIRRRVHRVCRGSGNHDVVGGIDNPICTGADDHLRVAGCWIRNELAILVRAEFWHVMDVEIGQADTKVLQGLRLDFGPVSDCPGDRSVEEVASTDRSSSDRRVFSQEYLVRGMRSVGLVLVDKCGRRVLCPGHAIHGDGRGPCQRHEAKLRWKIIGVPHDSICPGDQRIVRLHRHEHRAIAALSDQVQTMVKELAEEGHPAIEARRQANIRRLIGDRLQILGRDRELSSRVEDHTRSDRLKRTRRRVGRIQGMIFSKLIERQWVTEISLKRCRIVDRQIADEIGNDTRIGIHHVPSQGVVCIGDAGKSGFIALVGVRRIRQTQEHGVRRTKVALAGDQIVVTAIDRTQPIRRYRRVRSGHTIRVHDRLSNRLGRCVCCIGL